MNTEQLILEREAEIVNPAKKELLVTVFNKYCKWGQDYSNQPCSELDITELMNKFDFKSHELFYHTKLEK